MNALPKALLFDFDGTLVDSEPLHYEAWLHAVEPQGATTDWDDYQERFVGQGGRWAATAFFDGAGVPYDAELIAAAVQRKNDYFRLHAPKRLLITEEVVQSIVQLPHNLPFGVVTSSNIVEAEPCLKQAGLLDRLVVLICGGDVINHKPDPEPYLLGLDRLRLHLGKPELEAAHVAVYEDSRSGIAAAAAAGMAVRKVLGPHLVPGMLAAEPWN